jgi:hypothetical protein
VGALSLWKCCCKALVSQHYTVRLLDIRLSLFNRRVARNLLYLLCCSVIERSVYTDILSDAVGRLVLYPSLFALAFELLS